MKLRIYFDFYPVISKRPPPHLPLPNLSIDGCELNILWRITGNEPQSIYALARTEYSWPEHIHSEMITGDLKRLESGKKIKYYYADIHKSVAKLQKKQLVRSTKNTSGPRTKKMVKPTLLGLILYLQASEKKPTLFWKILKYHSTVLPFSNVWNHMEKILGTESLFHALFRTVEKSKFIYRVGISIKPLNLEFEGFLKRKPFLSSEEKDETYKERRREFAEFLKRPEAIVLRNSYIANLAVRDIEFLSKKRKGPENLLKSLASEGELAFFEERRVGVNSLFKSTRLNEFFPTFAPFENFFTGMFVENLLWEEIKKRDSAEECDFEVQFLEA